MRLFGRKTSRGEIRLREKLAVARSRSNMEVCAAAAFGDPLGNLLLRGIDNQDGSTLRRAKFVLSGNLVRRAHLHIIRANPIVSEVLAYFIDQRCPTCEGQRYVRVEATVRACHACAATGLLGAVPVTWGKYHRLVLFYAQGAIGRTLDTVREALDIRAK